MEHCLWQRGKTGGKSYEIHGTDRNEKQGGEQEYRLTGTEQKKRGTETGSKRIEETSSIFTGRESKRHCECERKRNEGITYGLRIGKKRVPLGVVGIIYESRPNVTADAFGLCLKSGNAVILRGGSDCIFSNKAIVSVLRKALNATQIEEDAVILIENTDRAVAQEMMRMNTYIDVLIPRGGAGLIQTVVKNSTVPVIETGTGNCHIYVDAFADLQMAVEIIDNAKTQRLGVCNACESLVIHEDVACQVVPMICDRLTQKGVAIRGDQTSMAIDERITTASDDDWGMEYLDKMISLKVVSSIDEAIAHINTYNTGHSESIITENYRNALKFQDEIDAAAVYVNASTRFTDGFEFGFGAEIGISTQKLHARGPMGLDALTTTKYIIFGDGQIR